MLSLYHLHSFFFIFIKFANIESNDEFLRETIKEIGETKNGNKNVKESAQ
jgi:hypothetical protein